MRMLRGTMLCALLLSGCKNGGGSTTTGPGGTKMDPPPIGSAIQLSDSQAGLEHGVTFSAFNFYDLPELWVRVITPDMPHATMLRLTFVNPKGVNIYTDDSMYTVDPAAGPAMHPAMNTPVDQFVVKAVPGGSALDRPVPISGTTFTRFPEEGDWQVQATLDGVPGTITAPMRVVIAR